MSLLEATGFIYLLSNVIPALSFTQYSISELLEATIVDESWYNSTHLNFYFLAPVVVFNYEKKMTT